MNDFERLSIILYPKKIKRLKDIDIGFALIRIV